MLHILNICYQFKGHAKESSYYRTTVLISHTSKVMLKILQARLQQYANRELSDVQAGFRKGGATKNQTGNLKEDCIHWIIGKAKEFLKTSSSASLTTLSVVWIATNCGKFFKRWEYQTTLPAS